MPIDIIKINTVQEWIEMNVKGSWESCGICGNALSNVIIVNGCDKTYYCWKCYEKMSGKPYALERQKRTTKCRGIKRRCAICGKLFEMRTPLHSTCSRACRDEFVKIKGKGKKSKSKTL